MADDPKIWMPVFIGDLLADTMHLTPAEFGAYMRIMFHQWRRGHMDEGDIPTITGMSADAWSIAQAKLKEFLSIDEAGLLFQKRTDREKEKATHNRSVFTKRATDAANKRWSRYREEKAKKDASSITQALLEQSSSDAHHHHPLTPSLRSGGAGAASPPGEMPESPPAKQERKGEHIANKSVTRQKAPQGAAGKKEAALGAARQRNTTNLHAKPPAIISVADGNRLKWLLEEIRKFWAGVNHVDPAEVPLSDRDRLAAAAMLQASPGMTQEKIHTCLEHRSISIELGYWPASLQPSKWLRDLPSFLSGPLTNFNESVPMIRGRYQHKGER